MHILLGLLGTIITILILVNRLSDSGIDLGWLNPFSWKRRREWSEKYHANPLYSLDSPMEVTAVLMVALAKCEGEVSQEQKKELINKFREVFHLDEEQAAGLLTSSSFLLKEDVSSVKAMDKLLAPSRDKFTSEQVSSAVGLLNHIANFDSPSTSLQREIIEKFRSTLESKACAEAGWS